MKYLAMLLFVALAGCGVKFTDDPKPFENWDKSPKQTQPG